MSEFRKIRTPEDAQELNKLYDNKLGTISKLYFDADLSPGRHLPEDEITFFLSIKDFPLIEFAFHGVIYWQLFGVVSSAFGLEFAFNHLKAIFWDSHLPKYQDIDRSTWILASEIEWRFVDASGEAPAVSADC